MIQIGIDLTLTETKAISDDNSDRSSGGTVILSKLFMSTCSIQAWLKGLLCDVMLQWHFPMSADKTFHSSLPKALIRVEDINLFWYRTFIHQCNYPPKVLREVFPVSCEWQGESWEILSSLFQMSQHNQLSFHSSVFLGGYVALKYFLSVELISLWWNKAQVTWTIILAH